MKHVLRIISKNNVTKHLVLDWIDLFVIWGGGKYVGYLIKKLRTLMSLIATLWKF